jgi:hypothetical protein
VPEWAAHEESTKRHGSSSRNHIVKAWHRTCLRALLTVTDPSPTYATQAQTTFHPSPHAGSRGRSTSPSIGRYLGGSSFPQVEGLLSASAPVRGPLARGRVIAIVSHAVS